MNDLRIPSTPLTSPVAGAALPGTPPSAASGEAFMASLKDAIAKVGEAQAQADGSVQALMSGQTTNLHETMIALEKADVSFQLMLQVRNKIVGAYEEIMRMQL
jgi:flagellar hook-basal body complex protein FliE